LAEAFGGEANTAVQKVCLEIKLFDALFNCIIAPYNRVHFKYMDGQGAFSSSITKNQPEAVQKYLFVALERVVAKNPDVMEYFARRSSRVWKGPAERGWVKWWNLTVDQADGAAGAADLLGVLFSTSAAILFSLVKGDLLERFKAMIRGCGPQRCIINLFASICSMEGKPMRQFQEDCLRHLWVCEKDRYDVLATFHQLSSAAAVRDALSAEHFPYPFGDTYYPNKTKCPPHQRVHASVTDEPMEYLGQVRWMRGNTPYLQC